MENKEKVYKRGDMVKCNYAHNESAVGEVVGYTPEGDIRVVLAITRKRTKTVDKVETILKPEAVEDIQLLYADLDDETEEEELDDEGLI